MNWTALALERRRKTIKGRGRRVAWQGKKIA